MRYRIKIVTYSTGRKEYIASVKRWLFWMDILACGETTLIGGVFPQSSREESLERIDNHYSGNSKVQTIEFEYINK